MLALRSNRPAKAEVPPNALMMSAAVIAELCNENRKHPQGVITDCVISDRYGIRQTVRVLTTVELLDRLEKAGIKNAAIARALNVAPSRVTELKKGERAIKLDEAAKLVAQFQLESPQAPQKVAPLSAPVCRLIVRWVAERLDCEAGEDRLQAIAEDVRAFAEYVADPRVRGSIDLQAAYFDVVRLRQTATSEEGQ